VRLTDTINATESTSFGPQAGKTPFSFNNPPSSFLQNPGASALIVRAFICVIALAGVTPSARAQSSPAPQPAATSPAKPTVKSTTKRTAPKAKASATPSTPAESGPCQLGVIPAIGDQFVVQKIGLTVFGNEEAEIPIPTWGLDDLVVARVRAAAPGLMVRKLSYAKATFDPNSESAGSGAPRMTRPA
jgi:hypothetical protein